MFLLFPQPASPLATSILFPYSLLLLSPSPSPIFMHVIIHNNLSLFPPVLPPNNPSFSVIHSHSFFLLFFFLTLWEEWIANGSSRSCPGASPERGKNGSSKRLWGRSITAIKVNKEKQQTAHVLLHTHTHISGSVQEHMQENIHAHVNMSI